MKTEAGLDLVWVAADGFPLRATERKLILFPTRTKRNNARSAVVAPAALNGGLQNSGRAVATSIVSQLIIGGLWQTELNR
jgi:hypothetical protein